LRVVQEIAVAKFISADNLQPRYRISTVTAQTKEDIIVIFETRSIGQTPSSLERYLAETVFAICLC